MFDETASLIDDILGEEACFSLRGLAINGKDVMALGLRGKEIVKALQICLDSVLDECVPNEHNALIALLKDR